MPGFSAELLSAILCPKDGGALRPPPGTDCADSCVPDGDVVCVSCGSSFAIADGVLMLMEPSELGGESLHEQKVRDEQAGRDIAPWSASYEEDQNAAEIVPTVESLELSGGESLLELGCGDGRYTLRLAGKCRSILAVDFSLESLRILKRKLGGRFEAGFVHADITKLRLVPGSFDRILSTLVSNLPDRDQRISMYRLSGRALKKGGVFVFSTHHFGFKNRLAGVEKSGRYESGGIYRYFFTAAELRNEVVPFFGRVAVRPIQSFLPFSRKLRLPLLIQSRILERIPLLRGLGDLLLCKAREPIGSG